MNAPPEKPNARRAPGAGRELAIKSWKPLDSQSLPTSQEPIFTAIPFGTSWQVKCLAPSGDVALFGKFDGRLPALGAAVLIAAQAEGRVLP
jgi:hypothetical protein